jgi:hypothetical protein
VRGAGAPASAYTAAMTAVTTLVPPITDQPDLWSVS